MCAPRFTPLSAASETNTDHVPDRPRDRRGVPTSPDTVDRLRATCGNGAADQTCVLSPNNGTGGFYALTSISQPNPACIMLQAEVGALSDLSITSSI
jgi:hypothetical protein